MAEAIAHSLATIGQLCEDMQGDIQLFPTEKMIRLVSDFYSHVFIFLSDLIECIMKKSRRKFLDSFNDDLVSELEDGLRGISEEAKRIRHLAEQSHRGESQFVRHKVEILENQFEGFKDMRIGATGPARQQAERQHEEMRTRRWEARLETGREEFPIRQHRLGYSVKLFLEENLRNDGDQSLLSDTPKGLRGKEYQTVTMTHYSPRGKFSQTIGLVSC